jgi:hypothetical protein
VPPRVDCNEPQCPVGHPEGTETVEVETERAPPGLGEELHPLTVHRRDHSSNRTVREPAVDPPSAVRLRIFRALQPAAPHQLHVLEQAVRRQGSFQRRLRLRTVHRRLDGTGKNGERRPGQNHHCRERVPEPSHRSIVLAALLRSLASSRGSPAGEGELLGEELGDYLAGSGHLTPEDLRPLIDRVSEPLFQLGIGRDSGRVSGS